MRSFTVALLFGIAINWPAFTQIGFQENIFHEFGDGTFIDVVDIGDINNDGLNDVVFGSGFYFSPGNDYCFFIFKQQPNGTLSTPQKLPYPESYPGLRTLQIGDVNNDNLNDIVFDFDKNMGYFLQLETGGWSQCKSVFIGQQINGLAIGDLNNDNENDVALINYYQIFILYQQPSGIFSKDTVDLDNNNGMNLLIEDINNDCLNDMLVFGGNTSFIIIYQDSLTGFENPEMVEINYEFLYFGWFDAADMGDMNNDGLLDIVGGIGGNTAAIVVFYQDSLGGFENTLELNAYDCPVKIVVDDLNCDGYNEIITASDCGGNITVHEQDTMFGGFFYYKDYNVNGHSDSYGMAVGDYNNDNRVDVAAIGYHGGNFLYNNSVPNTFETIDTTIINVFELLDTISFQLTDTLYVYDTTNGSIQITYTYLLEIDSILQRNIYHCDSVYNRYGSICGLPYDDEMVTFYRDTSFVFLGFDSTQTLLGIDTIFGLISNTSDYKISLRPNPVNDQLFIHVGSNNFSFRTIEVSIFSMRGEAILNRSFSTNEMLILNMKQCKPGLYIIEIDIDYRSEVGKFIKN